MSTKIFPMRHYNPDKCRAVGGLPAPTPPNHEDQQIMRELLAEQAALSLAKRAAAVQPRGSAKEPVPISVWAFIPELVIAYDTLMKRDGRRAFPPATRSALKAAAEFLRRFRAREECACEICRADITAYAPDMVPYGIFVCASPREIKASGLCLQCSSPVRGVDPKGETKDGEPCVITLVEWMTPPRMTLPRPKDNADDQGA